MGYFQKRKITNGFSPLGSKYTFSNQLNKLLINRKKKKNEIEDKNANLLIPYKDLDYEEEPK